MDQVDAWIKMLRDGNTGQREAAARVLGGYLDRRAIEPLRQVCMYDCAPSVRRAAADALIKLGEEPPGPVATPTPREYLRDRIETRIRWALDRSPNTKHEETSSKHTKSTVHVLREGDLELRDALHLEDDSLTGYGITAVYQGKEVFAHRSSNNLYIPGEWEDIVTRLAGKGQEPAPSG